MTTIINHDLRSADGGTIYMPPYIGGEVGWGNLARPDVFLATSVQHYPRGTMYRKGYNSWVHTKLFTANATGDAFGSTGYGGISQGQGMFSIAKPSTNLTVDTATKGETTLKVTQTVTANQYAGGYLTVYESTALGMCFINIVSNTTNTFTLDGKLPATYTSSANVYAVASPYMDVVGTQNTQSANAARDYCPGIFNSRYDENGDDPAANDFVWLQCAGLAAMWVSGVYRGQLGGERRVYIQGDSCAQVAESAADEKFQLIGTLFPSFGSATVGNSADPGSGGGSNAGHTTHIIMLDIRQ